MPLTVACPECQTPLEVDDQYRTWKVRCPQCRHEFKPDDVIGGREEYALVQVEDEDDEPRPRSRRRRRRRYFDEYGDPREGERVIQTPASVLEWIGWISVALILVACFILVVAGLAQPNRPRNRNNDDPQMFIFLGVCIGVLGVPYFGIIAYGARRLRSLSSHGWGMASAIMAIAALPLFGLCGFPIFGPGIWALVVMNNENVKAAFKQRERRRRHYDEDEEEDDAEYE